MFDVFEMFLQGERFEAHDKQWIYVSAFKDGFVLAVEEDAIAPALVHLVKYPREEKTEDPHAAPHEDQAPA